MKNNVTWSISRSVWVVFAFSLFSFFSLFASSADVQLLDAVSENSVAKAQQALAKGANPNFIDDDWPIFISVINSGNKGLVRLFLKYHVDVNAKGPDGRTPLMHAIIARDNTLINMLIHAGASLSDVDSRGKNMMMYAAEQGNIRLVKMLLSRGVNPALTSKEGKTALQYAIDHKKAKVIALLGKIETLPIDFGNAVLEGNEKEVARLLKEGADPNWKDRDGKPVIVTAVAKGFPLVVRHLLKAGADVKKSYFKNKSLTLFDLAMHNKQWSVAELLLKFGAPADLNKRIVDGKTAVMIAIQQNRTTFLREIMKRQFDVDRADDYGKTALMYAAEKNNIPLIRFLLNKGADPSLRQVDGKTARQIAQEKGFTTAASMLKF